MNLIGYLEREAPHAEAGNQSPVPGVLKGFSGLFEGGVHGVKVSADTAT